MIRTIASQKDKKMRRTANAFSILTLWTVFVFVGAYVPETDVEYLLYTRKNPTTPQRIFKNNQASLTASNFNISNPVKLTIHGWLGGPYDYVNTVLNTAFLDNQDCNMITVDWSKGSGNIFYIPSFLSVPSTGASIAGLLDWLNVQGVSFINMHVIGHSLGGHLAGNVGKYTTRGKVEYITGLDPGGFLWTAASPRMSPNDAKYVEAIHTNSYIYGLADAVGHNDFYPNGGIFMPGYGLDSLCSHTRSIFYFAESIGNPKFLGTQCQNLFQANTGTCVSSTKISMGGTQTKPAKNLNIPQAIRKDNSASLADSNFDKTKPVKITIHGWMGGDHSVVNRVLKNAFLSKLDVNVIVLDWSKGANFPSYLPAVDHTLPTGESLAGFLDWLNTQGVPFSNFHLLGHSLGAHVAGAAGRSTKRGKVEYITGLDPGAPLWGAKSKRLRKTDAKYVEIIHTNCGNFGLRDSLGHNDFYPNGGIFMTGCFFQPLCSHMRSIYYMAESIDNKRFQGSLCKNLSQAIAGRCNSKRKMHMGGINIKPALGIFHLNTNGYSPYALRMLY